MWCYEVKETSDFHLIVVCENEEQAQELFKLDLDNFINSNHDTIEDFEECYGEKYNDIIDKCEFEVDYELYATITNFIPIEIEKYKVLPNYLGGAQVVSYKEYKEAER
jgi:hypothetical protein